MGILEGDTLCLIILPSSRAFSLGKFVPVVANPTSREANKLRWRENIGNANGYTYRARNSVSLLSIGVNTGKGTHLYQEEHFDPVTVGLFQEGCCGIGKQESTKLLFPIVKSMKRHGNKPI